MITIKRQNRTGFNIAFVSYETIYNHQYQEKALAGSPRTGFIED
jgi:hypothetical protein